MKNRPCVLLTFDVEEFDLPLEFGQQISKKKQLRIALEGTEVMQEILSHHHVSSTLFTTATFAENFPEIIKELSTEHEIASHSYRHSCYKVGDIPRSKTTIEEIICKKIFGIRMPRMENVDLHAIYQAGYSYDSSLNPTWIPTRYNNFFAPRRFFIEKDEIIRMPASVASCMRIPLFWLTFKNIPLNVFLRLVMHTLNHDGYVCLYFHPWELVSLESFNIPGYINNLSGPAYQRKFNKLLEYLRKEADFLTISSFLKLRYPKMF